MLEEPTEGLHDASLETIVIDWNARTAELHVATADGSRVLKFEDIRDLSLPRHEPWGPSIAINQFRYASDVVEIEMQSGDVLRLMGRIVDE